MRQAQSNRRGRGRGRKAQNPLSKNYESNGPDVKIRGTAAHISEKYNSLARDSLSNSDIVRGENYLQHAEHYNRIIMAAQQNAAANGQSTNSQTANGQNLNGAAQGDGSGDREDKAARVEAEAETGGGKKPRGEAAPKNTRRRRTEGKGQRADNRSNGGANSGGGDETAASVDVSMDAQPTGEKNTALEAPKGADDAAA